MANNALKNLLHAGYGAATTYAGAKLFGSEVGTEDQRQQEVNARGRLNGSGPVNAAAAQAAPKSWTDFFFGSRASVDSNGNPQNSGSPLVLIVTSVIAGVILWYLLKGKK